MIVENEYTVKLSEIDKSNKVTNKAILSYLEDVGGKHSNIAGYGILDIPKTHLTWLLLEWKLQVIRRPNYNEKIKVTTWSKDIVKCYAYRDFEVFDEQENLIIRATSKWVLVNTEKGRIIMVEPELNEKYKPELDKFAFEENGEKNDFPKIKVPEQYQYETEYVVRKSDIDVNNHMHNLNYMDLANEALPDEVYKHGELDNVRITYKREIKLGEVVKCKYNLVDGKHFVIVKSSDEKVIHALIEMY